MDNMDIDSPPEPNPLRPCDRVVQRLAQMGIPEVYLGKLYPGVVAFVKENRSSIPELVSAVLPPYEEVGEVLQEMKSASKKALALTMKNRFRECMVWLQWMMFMGDPADALEILSSVSTGRGVCGAVWGNSDIAYRCRTCEHDPTCAICVPCFQNGNHRGHDYSIIYTGGGCCDCGDATAWKREGFCSKHKGAEQIQPLAAEFANSVGPVLDALFECWKSKLASVESNGQGSSRASEQISVHKKAANELTFVVVEMLLGFCKYSESLLSFVSKRLISSVGVLEILVRAEGFLSDSVIKRLHELLLKLLGEPVFKYEFAKAFLGYYPFVINKALKENIEYIFKKYPLLSTFSVQIFTVPTLTPQLVKEMNLLALLLGCLGDMFVHSAGEDGRLQVSKWGILYDPLTRVVEDIRFIMSHSEVPKYVTRNQKDILRTWMKLMSLLQGMNPMKRETDLHIEEENEDVNLPFVLGHSIANIHNLLTDGAFSTTEKTDDTAFPSMCNEDMVEDEEIRQAKVGRLSQESSVSSVTGRNSALISASKAAEAKPDSTNSLSIPSSVMWLTSECLRAIENCLVEDNTSGPPNTSVDDDTSSPPNTSSNVESNFVVLRKAISKIKRGKYIFGGLASSTEGHSRQSFSSACHRLNTSVDMENAKSAGKDCETPVSIVIDSSGIGGSSMGGDGSRDSDSLRFLSLCDWPDVDYDVSSQDVSVHIPLHRLLSLLLQKALRRYYGESAVPHLRHVGIPAPLSGTAGEFFRQFFGGCHPNGFSAFIMEHPLRNRVFIAEVHAGMWRKTGDAAILSCEWYRSVRWAEQGLESDLFLLQCCAAFAPPDLFVNRIVGRFGLSEYLSLNPDRSSEFEPVLVQEMLTLIIQIVQERRFSGLSSADNLKRELIHKLAIGDSTHSNLVKSLPRDLSKFDRFQEILDMVAAYSNPSSFNQGMYSLRWAYWKELDLYHPRWNSRDLQVAEERYVRHCSVSALTTQMPRWTSIYPPLNGVSRIATCRAVLQLIRTVLFYAVFNDKLTESRASDGVLLTALHLLSLALDISSQHRESRDSPFYTGDCNHLLVFATEEICGGVNCRAREQSLLSLLVLFMRMHKRENPDKYSDPGSCNLFSLTEHLLRKFAEIDSGCLTKLRQLAPEVVSHLSQSLPSVDNKKLDLVSEAEKRKAKARERQAAILAKMKAEQSKFLSSINSTVEEESESSVEDLDEGQEVEESPQDICSLCHDSNSKSPVSFLVLLQKSRILSFAERGPPSWDHAQPSDKELGSISTNKVNDQSVMITPLSGSGAVSSTRSVQLVQNAVRDRNTLGLCASEKRNDRTLSTFEMFEQDMYLSIQKEMCKYLVVANSQFDNENVSVDECGLERKRVASPVLLRQYGALLSREVTEHPSVSENAPNDEVESTSHLSGYDGFGPADSDGVHLSSCGHAVHQGCLDRYLSSLKERHVRRIVFEGGHIVDPDQGEFLCPVCRRLANCVLPSLPVHFQKAWKQHIVSTASSLQAAEHLVTSSKANNLLSLHQGLSLLQAASNGIEKGDFLKNFSQQRDERMSLYLEMVSRMLLKLYFPNRQDKFSRSARVNHSMIMWDTFKYTLVSTEIAARCNKTNLTTVYGLDALYKDLKSSGGFILSLLLKIVITLRSKHPLHVLQRLRGIQLFADSICSGVSGDGGNVSWILRHGDRVGPYPDTHFWNRAADPILAHDAFSSLMWVLFCLPYPFLSCEESLLSLLHIFYVVSAVQAIVTYLGKHPRKLDFEDCLITDISEVLGESGRIGQYFVSNNINPASDIRDVIRRLTFPYLRRCALLWKLLSTSVSTAFSDRDNLLSRPSQDINDMMDNTDVDMELNEVKKLENVFKIPQLDILLKDKTLRSVVMKWLHHFCKEYEVHSFNSVLYSTPAVPFRLMQLPHVYQDLLQRYIKQRCVGCNNVLHEPALCLLCGRLCCPNWKPCCRDSGCQTHAVACGAGTGVFLLIKRTTILLQRWARQAPWPSPYLDTFGEEDKEMHRGKPLYLNEERYAALTYLVASHGLDRSSKVLGLTTIGTFFLV